MSDAPHSPADEDRRLEAAGEWMLLLSGTDVSDETVAEWIEWCDADVRNVRAFEEMQSLWRAAAQHRPDAQQLALLKRPDARGWSARGDGRRLSRALPRAAAVAASIAALCAVGFVLFGKAGVTPSGASVRRAATVDAVSTPVAMNQQAILPDGSHVDLGARSALDVDFTGSQRRLQLRNGQAFFRVKHDSRHPFVVDAGSVRVIAVGTAFDVRKSGAQVTVTVQEGTVEVLNGIAPSTAAMRVTAGDQLVLDTAAGTIRRSLVDPEMAVAWRSGRLEFAGDPLDMVIASMNRYSARPIILDDPSLGRLVFTGTVFVESIDASLDGMQQVFPLQVQRSEHEIHLAKRSP